MTSLMTNLLIKGKFAGILGADFSLEQLHARISTKKIFGFGVTSFLSNESVCAASQNAALLRTKAETISNEARIAKMEGKQFSYLQKQIARIFVPVRIGNSTISWSIFVEFNLIEAIKT